MQRGADLHRAAAGGDAEARAELSHRYAPILQAFARRLGVRASAAEPAVAAALDAYLAAAREEDATTSDALFPFVRDHLADASLQASDLLQDEGRMRDAWDAQWRRAIIRRTLDALAHGEHHEKEGTVDANLVHAFELHEIEKQPASEVAEQLGMTRSAVFHAKQSLLPRVDELRTRLQRDF